MKKLFYCLGITLSLFLNVFDAAGAGLSNLHYYNLFGLADTSFKCVSSPKFLPDGSFYFLAYRTDIDTMPMNGYYNYYKIYKDTIGGQLFYSSKGKITKLPSPYLVKPFYTNNFDVDSQGLVYCLEKKYSESENRKQKRWFPPFYTYNLTKDSLFCYNPTMGSWAITPTKMKYNKIDTLPKYNQNGYNLRNYLNSIFINKKSNRLTGFINIPEVFTNSNKFLAEYNDSDWITVDTANKKIETVYFGADDNIIHERNRYSHDVSFFVSSFRSYQKYSLFDTNKYTGNFRASNSRDSVGFSNLFSITFDKDTSIFGISNRDSIIRKYGVDLNSNPNKIQYINSKIQIKGLKMHRIIFDNAERLWFLGSTVSGATKKYYMGFYKNGIYAINDITNFINTNISSVGVLKINHFDIDDKGSFWISTNKGFINFNIDADIDYAELGGKICYDINKNNVCDTGDFISTGDQIYSDKQVSSISNPDKNGNYAFSAINKGYYVLKVSSPNSKYFKSIIFENDSVLMDGTYTTKKNDIMITLKDSTKTQNTILSISSRFRISLPLEVNFKSQLINVKNMKYRLLTDTNLILSSCNLTNLSTLKNEFIFKRSLISDYADYNQFYNNAKFKIKNLLNIIGKKSKIILHSYSDDADSLTTIQSDTIEYVYRGAYDPNDKSVSPIGDSSTGIINIGTEKLTYTVRFQNKGNDYAQDVKITDSLDSNLDFSTFKKLASSHRCEPSLNNNGVLKFNFRNIMLPDSAKNEPLSHGFVTYSISPKKGKIVENSKVRNTAYIYFDFNPPIKTNTTLNTFRKKIITLINDYSSNRNNIEIYPNPVLNGFVYIKSLDLSLISNASFSIWDLSGKSFISGRLNTFNQGIDLNNLAKGLYIMQIKSGDGKVLQSQKLIVE